MLQCDCCIFFSCFSGKKISNFKRKLRQDRNVFLRELNTGIYFTYFPSFLLQWYNSCFMGEKIMMHVHINVGRMHKRLTMYIGDFHR